MKYADVFTDAATMTPRQKIERLLDELNESWVGENAWRDWAVRLLGITADESDKLGNGDLRAALEARLAAQAEKP
jgi:hypothetical protein